MKKVLLVMCITLSGTMASGKEGRTYYDGEMMARVRTKIKKHDWAKRQVEAAKKACEWLVRMSDEELWDFVPPPEQIRAINVCNGIECPFCGPEIIRKGGHYPWIMNREKPFKLQCPVCNRWFPENDFKPWNTEGKDGKPESGDPIIDKGIGWVDKKGNRYYFVAYYMFWQRWKRDIIDGMSRLAQAYLLTGDPVYAHKAAVLMAKVADEYERFDYRTQVYHEGIWNVKGRISDYIWTTGDDSTIALAYDAIYPIFGDDKDLLAFLKGKGIDDPRRRIETGMLHVMVDDLITGNARGNMGAHQQTMLHLAIVLANNNPKDGPTTEGMREWLMRGEGRVEDLLWNGFWRDGLGGESSPSYSSGWCLKFYELADLLPKIGVNIWDNPKLKKMADVGLDMTVADKFCPCIGDCGGVRGSGPIARRAELQGRAFTRYKDPRFAKALKLMNAKSEDLWEDYLDEDEVAKVVAAEETDLGLKTRNLGGYGLAILESGKGENRRAVSMYYGDASGGHGHYDRLTIGLFAHGHPMLPEMGYPTPFRTPKRFGWTSNTISHCSVVVDKARHETMFAGQLNTLVASPGLQLMDASAEKAAYPSKCSLYRRTCALIDISEENSYLVDIFRVQGGKQHDWSFHGPAYFSEFTVSGGEPGPVQEKGTLAGEDVPYGGEIANDTSGFQWLYNIRRMKPNGCWSATWRKPDEDLALTMMMPAGCAQEVITGDGEPELQPGNPKTIQYVVGRNIFPAEKAKENKLFSQYIAVVEPHRGQAKVTGVERLQAENASAQAVGVIVRRGKGMDLIHSSLSPQEECQWQETEKLFAVAAEFALLTLDEKGVKRAVLVNGTLLQYGDFSLRPAPSPQGKVVGVDCASNAITIDTALAVPETYRDGVIIIGNDLHQTSYTIKDAKVIAGATRLEFGDTLFIIGMGEVAKTDQAANSVTSDRELTGYGRIEGGRHAGRWLYNDDRSRGFRIASVKDKSFVLDNVEGDLDHIFADANGDGRRQYWISDIGPGDVFRIPATTTYSR